MNKLMKKMGTMMLIGGAGYGMYMMMHQKMPNLKMKTLMKSPYTMTKTYDVKPD